jgi:multidrug efflux pump subunit AcrA (membrane-fusion protein)
VRIGFDKLDPRILPEMSSKVAFRAVEESSRPAATVVLIPRSALRQDSGRDVVMVVQGGRLERRAVTVSSISDDEATLSSGLSAGEHVVLDGPRELAEGAMVREMNPSNP